MDAVAGLLDGPRARGAFLLRSTMNPPWALRIEDEAPLTLVAIVRGTACLDDDVRLGPGDVAILRGPDPYTFADHPDTPPQAVIHPGQRCTTPDGVELMDAMDLGVRRWGNSASGATSMLVGTYEETAAIGQRLLTALPPFVVLRARDWDSPLSALLATEIGRDEPGQDVVLDRLLDLLLVTALRAWFGREGEHAPPWYQAERDPIVGPALRLLHNAPARPWTVRTLASESGVSRATLARRFTELVGEPPMTYLTSWRLALAADLLREPDATIGAVAHQVGYGSPFALSAAFKRVRGISPRDHRLAAAAG